MKISNRGGIDGHGKLKSSGMMEILNQVGVKVTTKFLIQLGHR